MKKQEKTKEILNILYDLRALVTTNTNQDAIISYLNNLISQYENTNQTLHTHQTINTYKQLCYEVMTSFDREKHPEENRIFYVAYQRLKRAKNEKEAIYILEQALDIYSHDHPLQPNFRYIRPDEMKQYLKQHQAWLNYDSHGKQAMFFYCDLSLKHLQEADLDKAIFHHCLFHQSKLQWARFELSEFMDCHFNETVMDFAHVQYARFINCTFINCQMNNLYAIEALFQNTTFHGCDLSNSIFRDTNWIETYLERCTTENCVHLDWGNKKC